MSFVSSADCKLYKNLPPFGWWCLFSWRFFRALRSAFNRNSIDFNIKYFPNYFKRRYSYLLAPIVPSGFISLEGCLGVTNSHLPSILPVFRFPLLFLFNYQASCNDSRVDTRSAERINCHAELNTARTFGKK